MQLKFVALTVAVWCSIQLSCLAAGDNIVAGLLSLPDTTKILCGHPSTNVVNITIANIGLTDIPPSSNGTPNFNISLLLSDIDVKFSSNGQHRLNLNSSADNLSKGLGSNEVLEFHVSFEGYIQQEMCLTYKYLCANISVADHVSFLEVDTTDNIFCLEAEKFVKPPEVDVALSSFNYTDDRLIIRKVPGPYNFSIQMIIKDSAYAIKDVSGNGVNFNLWYFTGLTYSTDAKMYIGKQFLKKIENIEQVFQSGLDLSGRTFDIQFPVNLDAETCTRSKFLCLVVGDDPTGSYYEKDYGNNMQCIDLNAIKECKPTIEVVPEDIAFSKPPIRGYDTTVNVNITIKNLNTKIPIAKVNNTGTNFKLNVFLTNYDMKKIGDPFSSFKIAVSLNASFTQCQQGVSAGGSAVVSGMGTFLVERTRCPLVTHVCTEVIPGLHSSYSIFPGIDHLACFAADNSHRNCLGIAISGVTLYNNQKHRKSGVPSYFTVSWSRGSDVSFTIDFGDKSGIYTWSWKNTMSTGISANITVDHIYQEMGHYPIKLTAWNTINNVSYNKAIFVEPDLASKDPYIEVSTSHIATIKPVSVKVEFKLLKKNLNYSVNLICNVVWGGGSASMNQPLQVTNSTPGSLMRSYHSEAAEILINVTCYNNVSSFISTHLLIFRDPINNLKIISQKSVYLTNDNALFNVSMVTGSHVSLMVDFGDGISENFTNSNVHTSTYVWVINHIYKRAGNFTVKVTAQNRYSENTTVLQNPIIIQDVVPTLKIKGPRVVQIPTGEANFNVEKANLTSVASGIFCIWSVNDAIVSATPAYLGNFVLASQLTHHFNRNSIIKQNNISVKCFNLVSERTAFFQTKVNEKITGLTLPKATFVALETNFQFKVNVQTGSDVFCILDFEDGAIRNKTFPHVDATSASLVVQHQYRSIGNYTVKVTCQNYVNTLTANAKVIVHNKIEKLSLEVNETVIWPPGYAIVLLKTDISQQTLFNLQCLFNYGSGEKYVYVDRLDYGHSFKHDIYFPKLAIDKGNINVSCSNQISVKTISAKAVVILDAVVLGSLETMEPVWYTNKSHFTLHIERFANNSCFLWDMGDGTQYMYGEIWCHTNASEKELQLKLINHGISSINHYHVYNTWETYTVNVTAFNHVSQDFVSNKTVVKDWYCNKPKVHFTDSVTDKSANFTQIMRGVKHSIKPDNISVDCMKSLNRTESILNIFDYLTNKKLLVLYNVSSFDFEPRMLPLGKFYADYTLMMLGVRHMNDTDRFYFEVIKTPLLASIQGAKHEVWNFNEDISLNAFDGTIDPDLDPTISQGITFEWYCRQIDETFPTDSQGRILPAGPPNSSVTNAEDFSGCFGGGPGKLSEKSGKFVLETGLMIPNTTFVLTVVATNDGKTAENSKVITLEIPAAPEIKIECKENCEYKKRITGSLLLDANCTDNCKTKFGDLKYIWTLEWYNKTTGVPTKYTNLADISSTGNTAKKFLLKPYSLNGGVWHNATLLVWTPFSLKTITTYSFLTNLPPYGGRCMVEPDTGYAMETLFQLKCIDWKEWLINTDTGLKYEYRVRPLEKERSYLLYYGTSPGSDKVFLPLGNYKMNFQNEVVLYILDTVGDYYLLVQNVTVYPQRIPQSELLQNILAELNDNSSRIGQMIATKQYQIASSTIYSMLSMVNLPSDMKTSNMTEDEQEIVALKVKVRTAIIEKINSFPITSIDGLDQTNEVLISTVECPKQIEINTLDMASDKLENMSNFYVENRAGSTPEKKKRLVKDMTITCLGMIVSSDSTLKDSAKIQKNNDTSLNTTAVAVNETLSPVRLQVGNIMKKSVAVIDGLTTAQLDDKEVGTPKDVIALDQLTLVIEKEEGSKLSDTKFSTTQGSVEMGKLSEDLANSKCVKKSTVLSAINPYIWDETADAVTSSVLKYGMSDCTKTIDTTQTDKQPLTGTAFNTELAVQSVEEPNYVHTKQVDNNTIIFHYLDLSDTNMPAIASVYPSQNESYEVFVMFNKMPTLQDYQEKVKVPKGIDDATLNLDDLYELNHAIFISSENLTTAHATRVYIGVRQIYCGDRLVCNGSMAYSYKLSQTKCQIWDTATQSWKSEGCTVLPGSTPRKIRFKSNLFGSMGAGLFVGPNTIDFSKVFDNFLGKMIENAAVFWTVIGIIILFLPFVILCKIFDKKDRLKWMVLPLFDNNNDHDFGYEVHVYTGMKRNSGTCSRINFILAGTETDTGIRSLYDGQRKNFQTGDVNSFVMRTKHSLGIPCTMRIWHDNSGKGKTADWYLAKIVVVDLQTQKWYLFMCDDWLSTEQGNGITECILNITSKHELEAGQALLENNIKRKLIDDHLWISIGYRKTRSIFTRVQRLSCCYAILYLTMVSNAMWFGKDDTDKAQSAFNIGPISITVHQLYTSLMSSLIVVPPTVLISILFAKRDTSRRKSIFKKGNSLVKNMKTGWENEVVVKKKRKLPFWCIFVAYFLVFLSIACGAFFTILYAFEWGKAKSEEWLVAFLLSFVQSVLLIQPLKVVILAALLSFLFKKDTDVTDYENTIGKMQLGDENIKPANREILKLATELSGDEKQMLKKKQVLDKKMNMLVREIIYDAIFLFLLLWVVLGNQNENVFRQNNDLRNRFLIELDVVQRHNQTWKWLNDILLPGLYHTQKYNDDKLSTYDKKFISNGYAMRLGPPRLRQLRVTKDGCKIAKEVKYLINTCTQTLDSGYENHHSYGPSWVEKKMVDNFTFDSLTPLEQSFIYQSDAKMKGVSYWGLFQWYNGGGYVANLGNTIDEANLILKELANSNWIDKYTRVVFVEFNVWNANSNLFNMFVLTFEFPNAGSVFNWVTISSVNLYRYAGAGGLMNLLAEIILTILILVITILEIVKMVKSKGRYFKYFWNLILMFSLVCYYIGLGIYAWRSVLTASTVEEMMNNPGKTINFQLLVSANTCFMFVMGLMSFLVELRLLYTLRYIKSISVMVKTLSRAFIDILNVSVGFSVLFLSYTSILFLKYCSRLFDYRAFMSTATYLTTAFLGTKINFPNTIQETGYFGGFILLSYLLFMILFWINLFISVLDDYMREIRKDDEFKTIDFQVIGHLMKTLMRMLKSNDEKRKTQKPKGDTMPPLTHYKEMDYEDTAGVKPKGGNILKTNSLRERHKKERKYECSTKANNKTPDKWYQSNIVYPKTNPENYGSFNTKEKLKGGKFDISPKDSSYNGDENIIKNTGELFGSIHLNLDSDIVGPWEQPGENYELEESINNTGIDSGISSVKTSQNDLQSLV